METNDSVFCHSSILSVIALIATTIVLSDIKTAPTAGFKMIPIGARIPAAKGIVTILYPAPHQENAEYH